LGHRSGKSDEMMITYLTVFTISVLALDCFLTAVSKKRSACDIDTLMP
jgi:hypothetical protein